MQQTYPLEPLCWLWFVWPHKSGDGGIDVCARPICRLLRSLLLARRSTYSPLPSLSRHIASYKFEDIYCFLSMIFLERVLEFPLFAAAPPTTFFFFFFFFFFSFLFFFFSVSLCVLVFSVRVFTSI